MFGFSRKIKAAPEQVKQYTVLNAVDFHSQVFDNATGNAITKLLFQTESVYGYRLTLEVLDYNLFNEDVLQRQLKVIPTYVRMYEAHVEQALPDTVTITVIADNRHHARRVINALEDMGAISGRRKADVEIEADEIIPREAINTAIYNHLEELGLTLYKRLLRSREALIKVDEFTSQELSYIDDMLAQYKPKL